MNNLPNALDISNEEYHADTTRISKSGLDEISKSPAHYHYKYLNPERDEEEKDFFRQGGAAHCGVFESNEFDNRYTVAKSAEEAGALKLKEDLTALCDARGIAYKKAATKGQLIELLREAGVNVIMYDDYLASLTASGKMILPAKEFDLVRRWRDAVHKHPAARVLLAKGVAEKTFHFEEPNTGAPCKIRPDWLSGENFIVDLKTTIDASPQGFAKSVVKFRYDVAGGFYSDGLDYTTGVKTDGFIIIAAEKSAPYNIGVYILPHDVIERGRRLYLDNLQTYMECKTRNQWPGYSNTVEPITLPAWAR